jgi:hypothetical protein
MFPTANGKLFIKPHVLIYVQLIAYVQFFLNHPMVLKTLS